MNLFLSVLILLIFLPYPLQCFATTYWISPTGEALNLAACSGETPLSGTAACSYDKANGSGVQAGDIVYYRAGSYSVTSGIFISPYNSGTADRRITFASYPGEVVTVTGTPATTGIRVEGKSYIHITGGTSGYGFVFTNVGSTFWLGGTTAATYIEIDHCDFGTKAERIATADGAADGSTIVDDGLISFTNAGLYHNNILIRSGTYEGEQKQIISKPDGNNTVTVGSPFSGKIVAGTHYIIDQLTIQGAWISHNSQYNHIHHNTLHDWQEFTSAWDGPVILETGADTGAYPDTSYNVIEDNYFYHAGHHLVGLHGRYNVFRNNVLHNGNYYTIAGTQYGYRNFVTVGNSYKAGSHIIEGNKFGETGISYLSSVDTQHGGSSTMLASSYNILRYNQFSNILGSGLYIKAYSGSGNQWGECFSNHIYNNTFYHTGYTSESDVTGYPELRIPVCFENKAQSSGTVTEGFHDSGTGNPVVIGNVIKNQLYYDTWAQTTDSPTDGALSRPYAGELAAQYNTSSGSWDASNSGQIITGNLKDTTAVVTNLFTDPDISDSMQTTFTAKPHLGLVAGSSAINTASYLTTATKADDNTLSFADSRYFQDGNFGTGTTLLWPTSVSMQADQVCFTTSNTTVDYSKCLAIEAINYSTNAVTITGHGLSADTTYYVWLYKNSSGTRVLYGSAPDMGAHERSKQKFTGNVMIGGSADYD